MSEHPNTKMDEPSVMSLATAKDKIRQTFKLIVDDNDPSMIAVVLHQGFMADLENLLNRHETRLVEIISQTTKESHDTINQSLKILKDEALKGSLENVLAGVQAKARDSESTEKLIKSHRKTMMVMTGLQWIAVATFFLILK
ncbi:hypothetical protein [Kiloniella laminariae]|uniref:hypothetical protein n=1 Tax=Kiloniella laminariae TaxID=454162 RepID=UPI00035CDD09|nr:hypothetical protein [Kiloniella laminariae]